MRINSDTLGIHMIKYIQGSKFSQIGAQLHQLKLPVVVKPVDSQGSRGVAKVYKYKDVEKAFSDAIIFSRNKTVIVEELFDGREVLIEGFSCDNIFTNLIIGDSYNFDLHDKFIPKQRFFPSTINHRLKTKLFDINKQLVEKIGLKFGITHSEFIVDERKQEVCLIEIAARGGGVYISSDLIPLTCGIDVNDMLIDYAMGKKITFNEKSIKNNAAGYLFFNLPEGRIKEIHGLNSLINIQGVHRAYLEDIYVGKKIAPLIDKTSRIGPILLKGKKISDLHESFKKIRQTLFINVGTPKGDRGILW
jgi:biotin carboxylase